MGGMLYCFRIINSSFTNNKINIDSTLRFTLQPEDKQVCFGGSVTFDCEYQGTRERPSWCINSTIYPPVNLPPNHTYDGAVLTVHYAGTNLNNNTYQCFFPTLDSKSEFCHVSSHTSVLSVLSPGEHIKHQCTYIAASIIISIQTPAYVKEKTKDFALA